MQAGQWAAAADLFRKGLALEPESTTLRHGLGLALYWMGDGSGAEKELTAALRQTPDHVESHMSLGVLFAERKRFRDALAHFAAASKADPGRAEAQVGQAEMLRNLGELAASVAHWRRAVELDETNVTPWIEGARALVALDRREEARTWLARGRTVHPERPELRDLEAAMAATPPPSRAR